ncbi:MAG: hypothetical protein ABI212_06020 [Burkholderiaceae bacterium]
MQAIPKLIGLLLGPMLGGLIVHLHSWRDVFVINLQVGLAAFWFGHRHMPDYRSDPPCPFDRRDYVRFGDGAALLSWVVKVFGKHDFDTPVVVALLALSVALLAAKAGMRRMRAFRCRACTSFRQRMFRVVLGGFATRLRAGGLPFLLPLLHQVGRGRPSTSYWSLQPHDGESVSNGPD